MINQFNYKDWADRRTIEAIRKLPQTDTTNLRSSIQQVNHMTIVEELFKARLARMPDPHNQTNTADLPDLDSLCIFRKLEVNKWFLKYAKETPTEIMNR